MAPLKLAIIGAGPSSFYVASRLLSLFPKDEPLSSQLRIHIYDKLWAPHGLVRYGVAPDHPEVKVRFHPWMTLHPYPFSKKIIIHILSSAELHTQVRQGCRRSSHAFFWQRPGWASNASNSDLTRPSDIPLQSETALHPPSPFRRLYHPHFAPSLAAIRQSHSRIITRPLVYPTPFTTRAASSLQDGTRIHHRPRKCRSRRRTNAAHATLHPRKIRHPYVRARRPVSFRRTPRIYNRTAWSAPSSLHDKGTTGIDDAPGRIHDPSSQ
jgi:hypothetical protein